MKKDEVMLFGRRMDTTGVHPRRPVSPRETVCIDTLLCMCAHDKKVSTRLLRGIEETNGRWRATREGHGA